MKQYTSFTQWAFGPKKWHLIISLLLFLFCNYQLFTTPEYDLYVPYWVFVVAMVFFGWFLPLLFLFKVLQSWNDYKAGKSR